MASDVIASRADGGGRSAIAVLVAFVLILLVGLALRAFQLTKPLHLDEYPAVYAVVDRPLTSEDLTPARDAPLKPVEGAAAVRERSVMPFGVANPTPVYHYLLHAIVQALGISEWSLRVLSLVAGMLCIVGAYFLTRLFLGAEAGLVAALFVAVDPLQIAVSTLALPYALANLACLASFGAVVGLRSARPTVFGLSVVGYGLMVALMGYLAPLMLAVVIAHLGVVLYRGESPESRPGMRSLLGWLAGCGLATGLLIPQFAYFTQLIGFATDHRDYLLRFGDLRLSTVLKHNSTFLIALLTASIAAYIVRQLQHREATPAPAPAPAGPSEAITSAPLPAPAGERREDPLPDNPEFIWLARAWVFWPQLLVLVLSFTLGQTMFLSRHLSYTSLGVALLLAFWSTREATREARLGVSLTVGLAILLFGQLPVSKGFALLSPVAGPDTLAVIDDRETTGRWQPGDVLLVRPLAVEADFLPDQLPEATRGHVRGVLLAPYRTLYVSRKPRSIVLLSRSHFRTDKVRTEAGSEAEVERFYNAALRNKLSHYNQFWVETVGDETFFETYSGGDRRMFLSCFLPWLADALQRDLKVARNRTQEQRYFEVLADLKPEDYREGLSKALPDDFTWLVRVQRLRPAWTFSRAAAALNLPPGGGPGPLAVQAWLFASDQHPRYVKPLGEETPESKGTDR